jgi:periplasmic protein TonB
MNIGETNGGAMGHAPSEMEARIVAWISGEASASESAELEGLASARPELAAFRRRVEAMQGLAAEAVAPDRETLRLSEERRAQLMEAFGAERRRNLIFAAICSVLLVVGIARLGEITHAVAAVHAPTRYTFLPPFTIEPDPPVPVEVDQTMKETKPDIGPPDIPDTPVKPTVTNPFTVPIEPPQVVFDPSLTKIPQIRQGGDGPPTFSLSQLDERPVATYMARPIYPERMRQAGISGEVTVDFIVDPSGNVRNATAVHSSQRDFEESACTAVSKWKFRPGRKDGRAVYVHMQVPIVFTLSEQ